MNPPAVTAVIPAHNERGRIGRTVAAVAPYVDVVLVVDDASSDGTREEAADAGATVLVLPAGSGYVAAIKHGFCEAPDGLVVTIDGDGEHPAAAIPGLLQPIRDGLADMTQAARPSVPRASEALLNRLASFAGPVGDSGTGMRALSTDLARSLRIDGRCVCGVLALEVLSNGGVIVDVPIDLHPVDKPRRIAWHHAAQTGRVLQAVWRSRFRTRRRA